jgi:parallel beta-helix repeat protein
MAKINEPDPTKETITGDGYNNWLDRLAGGVQKKPVLVIILALFVMFGGLYAYEYSLSNKDLAYEDTETVLARGRRYDRSKRTDNYTTDVKANTDTILQESGETSSNTSQNVAAFTIEAEDYDEGGQGNAYYDASRGNAGGEYRNDDVDIEKSGDSDNGYNVGWMEHNEWLSYTFTTENSGSYDIAARVARYKWSNVDTTQFKLELDGKDITGTFAIPDTGGWHNWISIELGTVFVDSGEHKLVLRTLENNGNDHLGNVNWITFTPSDSDDGGTVSPPPPQDDSGDSGGDVSLITIQSEDYGNGGEGVSYHDADPENKGGEYRNDGVDIESTELDYDGYSIGWINSGEWLKYTFNASGTGKYEVKARVARLLWEGNVENGFSLELDGKDITGTIKVPGTGGWSTWVTLDGPTVDISQGQHELVFRVLENGRNSVFNVDWIKFLPEGSELIEPTPTPDPTPTPTPDPDPTPTPTPDPTPPPTSGDGYDSSTVGPKSSITCSGVSISPGESIASKASSYAEGTTFCIKKGTYYGQQVQPKSGQTFIGEVGAVMDGQNSTSYAFYAWSERLNVTIKNLEIKNYNTSQYFGAINMFVGNPNWYTDPVYGSGGWRVENCYIHHNNAAGIALGRDNVVVKNNRLNYNEQEGISLRFGKGQQVLNNEIGYNNSNVNYDWGNEAGGSKFWETENMVLDSNWVHDNHGPGLWSDHGNKNTTYSNNTVENNYSSGIFHEISYSATIFGNTVKNNGFGWGGWYWGAGIQIVNSGPAVIYDNYVEGNKNGIMSTHQDARGTWGTESSTVYGNTVVNSGGSGRATADSSLSGSGNWYSNTFSGSSYTVGL